MKHWLILFCIAISLTAAKADDGPKAHYNKTQKVDFEGSEVDGVARTPDGAYVVQKRGVSFIPLYDLKHTFNESIDSSVEYLK